jgi:hypothetical protein
MFNQKLSEGFQKASRRLPDLLEIGWKLELVLKNFGSWNHGVHIGVPICSRLKIKKMRCTSCGVTRIAEEQAMQAGYALW